MTIDKAREAEIRRLHYAEHWKVGTIAAQLGEHHDVVERVLGVGKAARPTVREASVEITVPLPLRGYEDFVTETLARYPRLRATRLSCVFRSTRAPVPEHPGTLGAKRRLLGSERSDGLPAAGTRG